MIPKKYITFLKFEREKTVLKEFSDRCSRRRKKMVKFISLTNICKHNIPLIIFLDGFLGL